MNAARSAPVNAGVRRDFSDRRTSAYGPKQTQRICLPGGLTNRQGQLTVRSNGIDRIEARPSMIFVRRDKLETALLADIQAGLLDPGVVGEIELRVRKALRSRQKDDSARRIAKLGTEVDHLVAAIGDGMISPALRQRLQTAEAELERLMSAPKPASIESLLPRLPELIRAHVRNITQLAEGEPVRARAAVQQALEADALTIRPAEAGRNVIAEYGLAPVQLATGTMAESVVAGARFCAYSLEVELR